MSRGKCFTWNKKKENAGSKTIKGKKDENGSSVRLVRKKNEKELRSSTIR